MNGLMDRQSSFFRAGKTLPLAARRECLERLRDGIETHQDELLEALRADLGKSPQEAYASEIAYVLGEIRFALRHLTSWAKPQKVGTPLALWPARSMVIPEPYGHCLILGPWNYPFQLLLTPLVGAIAAGNVVVIKPSEFAPATSKVTARLIESCVSPEWVTVSEGGVDVAKRLLEMKFDKIFFTGGTATGRQVMAAAANQLTPVTLELGGKCPCLVMADAPIEITARRILWGKFMNAGQTCVAPDHVWVEHGIAKPLIEAMKRVIVEFYGVEPQRSPDYGRIVNERHVERLKNLLDHGKVIAGGTVDSTDRYVAPTLMAEVSLESPLMQEEIFGPILPILEFVSLDEIFSRLRDQPAPLALYLFTKDKALQQRVLEQTRSGGVCVNDTISHLLNRRLPFGGLGDSGMGASHGKAGFDDFSHRRSVMTRGLNVDPSFRYPPLGLALAQLKRALRFFGEG